MGAYELITAEAQALFLVTVWWDPGNSENAFFISQPFYKGYVSADDLTILHQL